MKEKVVLVAGSGNVTGINVLRALLSANIKTVGSDFQVNNPANKFCKNEIVPLCSDPSYITRIADLIAKYEITHVIATNDHDVRALVSNIDILKGLHVKMNGVSTKTLSYLDKFETSTIFSESGALTPEIISDNNDFPYVLRINNMGNTKKYLHVVFNNADKREIKDIEFDKGIMTRFIDGEEYTVDVLCDDNFKLISAIPRLRVEVRNGMVHYAKIINDNKLILEISELCFKLNLTGLNCIQCIKNNDKYYFIEVNPRPGSGIDLTINAGVNMPSLWVNPQNKSPEPNWNLKMIRYYEGYFFE